MDIVYIDVREVDWTECDLILPTILLNLLVHAVSRVFTILAFYV